ncbi:MAG TPA: TraB/GumN family protein [Gammaproteobacteria bacterium]|nr:TraB/GumN family protein [Gammaproteobacteria bacterium]
MRWFIVILALYASQVFAETSLWRVSDGANVLFLGGTIHVLSKDDYPLPAAFDKAYAQSGKLVFETDVGASQDPAFAQAMMQRMMFTDGNSLKTVLRADVYQQLQAFGAERGLPMQMLERMRPPLAVLTLTFMELQRMGMAGAGVDSYYFHKAQADKKSLGMLETTAEQLDFLVNMGRGRENDFVSYSLRDLRKLAQVMRDMKSAWRDGKPDALAALGMDTMRKDFPAIYQQLLVQRNRNWVPKIDAMLHDPGTELVLVGALHLVGEEGVLAALRAKGYRIQQW